jgi:GcrA cell cycle regulator
MTRTCLFPEGDPRAADFSFCGEPVTRPGSSYCAEHEARAYRKERVRPRLKKSQPAPRPAPA